MKLSIRMKIFLPVMLLLIVLRLTFWLVFRSSLDVHMYFNIRRSLVNLGGGMDGLIGDYQEQ